MKSRKSQKSLKSLAKQVPILSLIGNTPLVAIRCFENLAPKLKVFLKAEWMNPGGSLKDRPVRQMLLAAIRSGELHAGKTILDSSSGNAGIAYALIGGALGFSVEIVIPGNASAERFARLAAHGAKVRKTDPLKGYDEAIRVAHQLGHEKGYFLCDQYGNARNWQSHYQGTGAEILEATHGKITHFVGGVGTGGSLTGIGRRLKEHNSKIQIIMIEPERFPGIEGLKPLGEPGDFVPANYDPSLVDRRIPVSMEQAAQPCLDLARQGIFAGQSTGAYLHAVEVLARERLRGTLVTLGCDTGERYFSAGLWTA